MSKCWLVLDFGPWRPHIPAIMDEDGEVHTADWLSDFVLRWFGWRWFGEVCMSDHKAGTQ